MLAHVPSFERNSRDSLDFLVYPVPKAYQWRGLGTGVPRCLGVARSASVPNAAQALGCILTTGLRVKFGGVICMARAASVPGLCTLGLLLLCNAGVLVRDLPLSPLPWLVLLLCVLGFRLLPPLRHYWPVFAVCAHGYRLWLYFAFPVLVPRCVQLGAGLVVGVRE